MISTNISSFLKTSFCDWPGRMSSIIFVRGCNFRCPTCHNYELLETSETIDLEKTLEELKNNSKWIDHVTISGGEPTIYNDLDDLVYLLRKNGFKVKLDTNGSNPFVIYDLISIVSLFSIDIKGPFRKYPELTGYKIDEETIRRNFMEYIIPLAKNNPSKFQFRTTLVPSLKEEDISEIKSYFPPMFSIQFQDYQEVF